MKVQIEGNMYLESDTYQFILKEYTGKFTVDKKTGKETEQYKDHGNYPSIHSALKAFLTMKIKESTATNLQELSEDIKRIEAWIKAKFEVELQESNRVAV